MKLPRIYSYSQNTPQANCMCVELQDTLIWYSYETPVAFHKDGSKLVVRKNDWSTTTGKHINWIDNGNKKARVDGDVFEALLTMALGG